MAYRKQHEEAEKCSVVPQSRIVFLMAILLLLSS